MKRIFAALLLVLMILPAVVACTPEDVSAPDTSAVSDTEESEALITDKNAASFWKDTYKDSEKGIDTADKVYSLGVYADGVSLGSVTEAEGTDIRYLFGGNGYTRAVNLPE